MNMAKRRANGNEIRSPGVFQNAHDPKKARKPFAQAYSMPKPTRRAGQNHGFERKMPYCTKTSQLGIYVLTNIWVKC